MFNYHLMTTLIIVGSIYATGFLTVFMKQIIDILVYDRKNGINRKDGSNNEMWFLVCINAMIALVWPLLLIDYARQNLFSRK